jgi:CubicO group peptidase (beta-lactamase class C family)
MSLDDNDLAAPAESRAAPHELDGLGAVTPSASTWYTRAHAPSGTLWSTVHEMSRFATAVLRRSEVLPPAAYDDLFRPMADTGRRDRSRIALGWFVREHRGRRVVGHGGWDLGFRAGLSLLPDEGLATIVMCNFHWSATFELCNAMLDVLLGIEPEPIFDEPDALGEVVPPPPRTGAPRSFRRVAS